MIFNPDEDALGSLAASDKVLAYPRKHYMGGHTGQLGTRGDKAPAGAHPASTAFMILESIRLDQGLCPQVRPLAPQRGPESLADV